MSVDPGGVLPAAVIVPTRGRPELLSECVESILASIPLPAEIVVVDQSDTPHTRLDDLGEIRGCRVTYCHSSSRGTSVARNQGCQLAGEQILLFIDDDILVSPDWAEKMTRAVEREADTTLISGRVRFIAKDHLDGFAPSLVDEEQPKLFEGRVWSDVLFGGNMAFHRRIFNDLGPFDARLGPGTMYRSAEDNDYCLRALEAGYRIRYMPEAIVHHQAWRPKDSRSRVKWIYGVGQGAYFAKHIHLRDRYTLLRLRNELCRYTRRTWERWRTDPAAAKGDAIYVMGLLYGSARWTLLERLLGG